VRRRLRTVLQGIGEYEHTNLRASCERWKKFYDLIGYVLTQHQHRKKMGFREWSDSDTSWLCLAADDRPSIENIGRSNEAWGDSLGCVQ
jgi:hypothetical protein